MTSAAVRQDMQVGGLPSIDRAASSEQEVGIAGSIAHRLLPAEHTREPGSPARLLGRAHVAPGATVRRSSPAHRTPTTRRAGVQRPSGSVAIRGPAPIAGWRWRPRPRCRVAGASPVQHPRRSPPAAGLGGGDHFRRGVNAGQNGVGATGTQGRGQGARTAAKIDDLLGFVRADPCDQLMKWPAALVGIRTDSSRDPT